MIPQPEPEVEYWSHAEALKRDAANAEKAAAMLAEQAREDEARRGGRPLKRWSNTPVGQMELLVCQSARSVRKGLRIVEKLDLALPTALSEVMQSGGKAGNANSAFSQDLVTSLVIAAGAAWQGVVLRMVILNEAIAAYVRVAEAYKTIRATETIGMVSAANSKATPKSKQKRGFLNTGRPSDDPDYVNPISEVERARRMRRLLDVPDDEFPAPAPAAVPATPEPEPEPAPEPEPPQPLPEPAPKPPVPEPEAEPAPAPQPAPSRPKPTITKNPAPYITYHQSYRDRLEEKPICLFI